MATIIEITPAEKNKIKLQIGGQEVVMRISEFADRLPILKERSPKDLKFDAPLALRMRLSDEVSGFASMMIHGPDSKFK